MMEDCRYKIVTMSSLSQFSRSPFVGFFPFLLSILHTKHNRLCAVATKGKKCHPSNVKKSPPRFKRVRAEKIIYI